MYVGVTEAVVSMVYLFMYIKEQSN